MVDLLSPLSPTQFIFGGGGGDANPMASAGSNSGGKKEGSGSSSDENGGGVSEESTGPIQQKEFFWDQFLVYVSTIIALLTVLDVTLQFFRGGGLVCRVPSSVEKDNVTLEITRDEVAYINTFCQQSLTRAEYYPFFVLIQGLLVAAPQYLWSALFVGQFDFFFGLVQQLDRLRSRETGEYRGKNFEIVKKLEKQFPRKRKWVGIFMFYILKLCAQLVVVTIALIVNGAVFQDRYFNFSFDCPENLNPPPNGWCWSMQVSCVFSSFRLHRQLRGINLFLLCLAFVVIVYGLWWCAKRHVNALGFEDAALFAFSSCLRPNEYVEEKFFHDRYSPFNPRIKNDLDFLLMRLFRADSGHGLVFKDIQIEGELKKRIERDHELLHLYVEASKDRARYGDLRQTFWDAGFVTDPEKMNFDRLKSGALGNITWESIKASTIRNIIFGFLQFVDKNDFAMDISFGSTGYSLILARAFKDVLSLNFDPFYANDKDVFHLQTFHADYTTVRFQENILTLGTAKLNKLEVGLSGEFEGPCPGAVNNNQYLNLVLVGPFTDSAKIATVNLFLERQKNATRYAKYCILMYIRPVKIGPLVVKDTYCSFTPPSDYFQKSGKAVKLSEMGFENKIKEAIGNSASEGGSTSGNVEGDEGGNEGESVSEGTRKNTSGVVITDWKCRDDQHYVYVTADCHKTKCQFEISLFEYCGELAEHRAPNLPPGAEPFDQLYPPPMMDNNVTGNIALIIPSRMLPQLDQDKMQQFMKGTMAMQLHATLPESPIQFVLPLSQGPNEDHEHLLPPPNNDISPPNNSSHDNNSTASDAIAVTVEGSPSSKCSSATV